MLLGRLPGSAHSDALQAASSLLGRLLGGLRGSACDARPSSQCTASRTRGSRSVQPSLEIGREAPPNTALCAPASVVTLWTRLWVAEHPSDGARSVPQPSIAQSAPETHGQHTSNGVSHDARAYPYRPSHCGSLRCFLWTERHDVKGLRNSSTARQFLRSHRRPASCACCEVASPLAWGVSGASSDPECSVQNLPNASGGKDFERSQAGAIWAILPTPGRTGGGDEGLGRRS